MSAEYVPWEWAPYQGRIGAFSFAGWVAAATEQRAATTGYVIGYWRLYHLFRQTLG